MIHFSRLLRLYYAFILSAIMLKTISQTWTIWCWNQFIDHICRFYMRTNRNINFAEMSSDLARLKSASCAERLFLSVSVCATQCSSCSHCFWSEVSLARLGRRSRKGLATANWSKWFKCFPQFLRVGKNVVECLRIFFFPEGCIVAVCRCTLSSPFLAKICTELLCLAQRCTPAAG